METLTEYLEEFVENLEGGAGRGYDVEYSVRPTSLLYRPV